LKIPDYEVKICNSRFTKEFLRVARIACELKFSSNVLHGASYIADLPA